MLAARRSSSSSSVASTSALEFSARMSTPISMLEIVGSTAPASPSMLEQRPRQAVEGDLDYFVDEKDRQRHGLDAACHSPCSSDEFVDWTSSTTTTMHVASSRHNLVLDADATSGAALSEPAALIEADSPLSWALSTPAASVAFALAHSPTSHHNVEELTLPGLARVLYGMPHTKQGSTDWMHSATAPLPHGLRNNDVVVFSYNETYRFPAVNPSTALDVVNDAALHEKRFEEAERRLSQSGNAEWMEDSSNRAASVATTASISRQPTTFTRASPSPRRASFAALSPAANNSLAGGLESLAMAWWQQQQVSGAISSSQAGMQPPAWVPAALANRRATVASGDLTPAAWFASQAYAESQQSTPGYPAQQDLEQSGDEQWWSTAESETIDPMLNEEGGSTEEHLRREEKRRGRPTPLSLDTSGAARSLVASVSRSESLASGLANSQSNASEPSDLTAFMRSCEQNVGPPGLALQHFASSSPATMEFFAGHAAGSHAHSNPNGLLQPPTGQQQEHRRAQTTPGGYTAAASTSSSAALLPPPPAANASSWTTYSSLAAQRGAPSASMDRSSSYGSTSNPFRSAASAQQRSRYEPYPTSAAQHVQRRLDNTGSERAQQAAYRFPDNSGSATRSSSFVPSGSTVSAMDRASSSGSDVAAGSGGGASYTSSRKSVATEAKSSKGGSRRPATGRASVAAQPSTGTPPPSFAPSHITREIVLCALPSSRGTEDVWYPTVENLPRTAVDPPPADFEVTAADAAERLPRSQTDKMRFKGDLYTPTWVRGTGMQREAWCDKCEAGGWMQLKNSQYWYHVRGSHGISPATGRIFPPPTELRCYDDAVGTTEGYCTSCSKWIQICTAKRKRDFSGWFKHCAKCISAQSPSAAAAAAAAAVASSSAAAALEQQQQQHHQREQQEQQQHPDTTARMVELTAPSRASSDAITKRLRR